MLEIFGLLVTKEKTFENLLNVIPLALFMVLAVRNNLGNFVTSITKWIMTLTFKRRFIITIDII